ncbi:MULTISPECIES: mechanosensitive ion channel family protein [Cutibacterium]|jgi:transporter, small conductance mechanosensitive ion channel MscS family protein|uniref:Mechanosensitive ion channel family protein n=1 Tax=Cutibacterium namnetense TaxID=1574624 RepID=A0ABX9I9Q2_9ACTN|nr:MULTISPECIES: mechanosensitive ion channel domain-containing protein [Cutibacterium]EHC27350.1 hypothetical protein HMPREF1003_00386 [Propionibacterium sp. 5_U_42AFAA]OFO87572.1 mechanosensitive ion channel protein MscS [Propionibacterium sp. HMSC062D05]AEW82537.1 transporter, small conductance mechanosensitive ion channel (MscS) family protein [Cutibacterium acnes TypeIA2 P.acn17]ALT38593.1 mechanosensitive ion channel protein MscS [Cutibacterium acnes]EFS40748.1 transporter, small conduct
MPPLKSDVWTWDTLIHILIIIALAIVARWLLRKGVDWTIRLMVSRSEKREATMPGRTRRILAEATGATLDRQNQRTTTVGGLLSNVGVAIIIIVALLSGFSTIGIKITPILTSAGIVGVALAFGAQTLVKDVLAGLFIIFEDQYGIGDAVRINEVEGVIEDVGLRVTRIRDWNGVAWYLRNGEITKVGNVTQGWTTSFTDIKVHSLEDPNQVIRIIRKVLDELAVEFDEVLIDKPMVLGVGDITGDTMTFQVMTKCLANKQFDVLRALRRDCKNAFDAAHIRGAF